MRKKKQNRSSPQASGYSEAGASIVKRSLRGFQAVSLSPLMDIDMNNMTLRQRARMLYMAAPIATAAIETNKTKVVGVGLNLQSTPDAEFLRLSPETARKWRKKTELEWRMWSGEKKNCDALGMNNFAELQQLALISWLLSGDVFALFKRYDPTPLNPYSLRIHLIEADRISTPTEFRSVGYTTGATEGKTTEGNLIHDGVEVDKEGCVIAYHICNSYPYPGNFISQKMEWTRIAAYGEKTGLPNILQIMTAERPDQYRGVPYLAKVIEPLLQVRRYTESEIMAALIQSFFTAWIETMTNPAEIPFNETGPGDIAPIPGENPETNMSDNPNEYEMGPGTVNVLGENEKVVFGSPNIPTAGFDVFVKAICRQIGAALGIPYEVLLKEFNSSYSASRAALLEAWEGFRTRRQWFVNDFCQPIYKTWLAEAVARGRIQAPGFFVDPLIREAWSGARWIGPIQGQIDPLKESNAAVIQLGHGIKTHQQVTREMGGGDWDENVSQLQRENQLLRDAGTDPVQQTTEGDDEDETD
ncbi:MAG: phage portal protein [Acidaminococcaceae bacterium]|nr:phage portal protein [Acidaminococcaceae bacterium]